MSTPGYPRPNVWESLNTEDSEIRILRLDPVQNEGEPLRCSLQSWSLDRYPRYDAISWAWGRPGEILSIIIGGLAWQIPSKLESCLRRLHTASRERAFWVDAICVNQFDPVERAHQVELMERIFSGAGTVWAWLGHDPNSTWRLSALHALAPSKEIPDLSILGSEASHFVVSGAVFASFSEEWWYRVWPMQEVILAANLKLCFDDQITELHVLQEIYQKTPLRVRQINDLLWLADFRSSVHNGPTNTNLLFIYLLGLSRSRSTTDPRDRVYGLLGVCTFLFGKNFLQPDYTKPAATVYQQLASCLILRTKSLALLNQVVPFYHTDPSLPSWVPDLGARYSHEIERRRLSYWNLYQAYCSASFEQPTAPNDLQVIDSTLVCSGATFDKVSAVFELCEFRGARQTEEQLEWFKIRMLSWLHQYHEFVVSARKAGRDMTFSTDMFATTILRSIDKDKKQAFLTSKGAWIRFHRLWVFSYNNLQGTSAGSRPSPADIAADKVMRKCSTGWLQAVAEGIKERNAKNLPPKERFSTEAHHRRVGEAAGECYLRIAGTRFFITDKGETGLGPADTQVGDDLAVLTGGNVPYVLRKRPLQNLPDEKTLYNFVGECYVHGAMQGEIGRNGEKLEEIILV